MQWVTLLPNKGNYNMSLVGPFHFENIDVLNRAQSQRQKRKNTQS